MTGTLFPALAALAVFAACVLGASPSAYWLDSAELVAAAHALGVPHPPGHPAYVLTAKPFDLLPLGAIPFRVGLASAAALAASAALLATGLRRVAAALGWEGIAPAALGAGLATAVCFSYGAAFQGVRAEVYALHLLLALAVVDQVHRYGESEARNGRHLSLAAGLAGLGLANHHYLLALAAAPLAAYALWRGRGRGLAPAACALALALGAYLVLPLRASRAGELSWGRPASADRFAWVVSARAFQKSVRPRTETSLGENALGLTGVTMEALTPVGAVAGLVGLGLLVRRRRALGLALAAAGLLTFASQITMPADPANPDVHGYLLLWMALLTLGVQVLLASLAAVAPARGAAVAAVVLAVGLPAAQLWTQAPRWSLAGFHAAEEVTRPMLRDLPPRSLLLSAYFKSVFLLWHARAVEGERPDVILVHRGFLAYPGYREALPSGAPREITPDAVRREARERPVFVELDPVLQPWLSELALPGGWLWRVGSGAPPDPDGFWRAVYARCGEALAEPETRRFFLWSHWNHALGARARGWTDLARAEARRGLTLAPGSPELEALLR